LEIAVALALKLSASRVIGSWTNALDIIRPISMTDSMTFVAAANCPTAAISSDNESTHNEADLMLVRIVTLKEHVSNAESEHRRAGPLQKGEIK
jgi:hypothetical protein